MSYTYATFKTSLAQKMVLTETDADFLLFLPEMIQNAELRIYRDLDPMISRKYGALQMGSSTTSLDQNAYMNVPADLVVIRSLGYFTPVNTVQTLVPLERRDEEFINDYWPNLYTAGIPKFYCELGYGQIRVAPTPNAGYSCRIAYTYRPDPLSATTTTTFLSTWYPDLLLYGALVEASGFQKNFGAAMDDPKMSLFWEAEYRRCLETARVEEGRRKAQTVANQSPTQPQPGNI